MTGSASQSNRIAQTCLQYPHGIEELSQCVHFVEDHTTRELGIADSTLHHWCKEFAQAGEKAFPGSGNPPVGEEELRRLKRELEVTRQERDILKKALAIFSRSQL
ncbi:hypothetical protein KSF_007970 [Reticulibacter mediterranei]|uniref:Transposase n=1 Tax=Reticulibacter mediterranei TaxID=2778369 RepID=A0A8J3I8E1_9CHLR|nr:hypothetical protein KSF_007970 [Reticulibacter mediterranei]